MNNWTLAGSFAALSLLSFFVYPGHTYLIQDTQIYVPILEHLWDPSALTRDILVERPHVAFTLYDEFAIALRWLTRSNFALVLQTAQIVCRALGIWGVYLIANAILGKPWQSLVAAAVSAAGAEVWGPAVLTVEFEPSPRAFAIPLLFLAIGLTAQARYGWAGAAAAIGFILHPPSVLPFWVCFVFLRQYRAAFVSLAAASVVLLLAAHWQSGITEPQVFFARVPPALEAIQRLRGAYNWVGIWWPSEWPRYLALTAAGIAAFLRIRSRVPAALLPFLLGLPLLGLLSVPLSYVFLDRLKWAFMPQLQPVRTLLFLVAVPILLAVCAAFLTRRKWEAPLWLALAITPAVAEPRPRIVRSPALTELIRWADANTPKDSVFLFPQAGKSLEPGLFRSEALRAIYVDWKGGGQVNYLPEFGFEWWRRYQDVMLRPQSLDHYRSLGIDYIVFPGTPYRVISLRTPNQ